MTWNIITEVPGPIYKAYHEYSEIAMKWRAKSCRRKPENGLRIRAPKITRRDERLEKGIRVQKGKSLI
jgi:hypothetical protein